MMENINSVFRFDRYIVKEVQFDYNLGFDSDEAIDISFDIDASYEIDTEKRCMVTVLDVTIFDNPIENNYPFKMYIKLAGIFSMQEGDVKDMEKFKPNSISILFPYARALVTSFTASANVTPLILPTINVNAYIQQKKKIQSCDFGSSFLY